MKTTITKKANQNFYGSQVNNETWEIKTVYQNGSYKAVVSIIFPIHRFVRGFFGSDEEKVFEKAIEFAKDFEVTKGIMDL